MLATDCMLLQLMGWLSNGQVRIFNGHVNSNSTQTSIYVPPALSNASSFPSILAQQ